MSSNDIPITYSYYNRTENEQETSSHNVEQRQSTGYVVPWSLYSRPENRGSMYAPWRLFEERVRNGPYGLTSFPSQPYSPIRILILEPLTQERVNPRLRQFIRDSPPRIRNDWHLTSTEEPNEPSLSDSEFKQAMKKIKKQVYSPNYPRKRAWKKGMFGKSSSSSITINTTEENEEKEEGKDCTICLEPFVPNQQVLVTPCNHMFHGDCLVPWVRSHGQCPVCRFVMCERKQRALSGRDNYERNRTASEEELAANLLSLVRAMEEAFNWVDLSR